MCFEMTHTSYNLSYRLQVKETGKSSNDFSFNKGINKTGEFLLKP